MSKRWPPPCGNGWPTWSASRPRSAHDRGDESAAAGRSQPQPRFQREELSMFANTKAYSGFAVDDLGSAREFYGDTLGLHVSVMSEHLMSLDIAGDRPT